MNIIKKTALTFIMAILLGASSVIAFAEETITEEATTEEATTEEATTEEATTEEATTEEPITEKVTDSSASSINETIAHIEKALNAVNESDFAAAHLHLKAARASSGNITGNEAIVKKANGSVIKGQIQSKHGNVKKTAAELHKAIELYKSLLLRR